MVTRSDAFYMRLALEEAWKYQFLTYPNPAVGAAVVDQNGAVLGIGAHKEAGSAHAELIALRDAYAALSGDSSLDGCEDAHRLHETLLSKSKTLFSDATLYVTLEPCAHTGKTPSCAALVAELGFKRVVIGTADPNEEAAGGADRLRRAGAEVVIGVEKRRCEELIEPFVKWREGRFLFFKLAQTLNGVIDGGTISSEESRRWVHEVRSKIERLLIGGNTVRTDRPLLDSRLAGKRAPDVTILTRNPDTIDREIPLFRVPERSVDFAGSVAKLPKRGLVMAEGGTGTLYALKDEIDWMVLFVSPVIKAGMGYNGAESFELLHQQSRGGDAILWLRAEKNGR